MAAAAAAVVDCPNSVPTSDLPNKQKSRVNERRRRRRKVKKNKTAGKESGAVDADSEEADGEDAKENTGPKPRKQIDVEVEYVPEKADLDDPLLDDFRTIFETFCFKNLVAPPAEGEEKGAADAVDAAFR